MSLKNAKQSKNKQEVLRILNKKKSRSIEEAQRRENTPAPPAPEADWGTPPSANRRPTAPPPPNWSATEGQDVEKTCRGEAEGTRLDKERRKKTNCRGKKKEQKNKRIDKKPTNSSRRRPRQDAGVKSVSNGRAGSAVTIPRQFILAQCRTEKLLIRIRKILSTIVKRMKKGQNDKKPIGKKKKKPKKGLSFLTPDGQFPRFCSEAVKKIESQSVFNDGDIPWFSPPVKSSVAVTQDRECSSSSSIPSNPTFSVKGSNKNYEEEGSFSLHQSGI